MNRRWAERSIDAEREVTVWLHPTATFAEILAGTAVDEVDLSPFVTSSRQTEAELHVTLTWHDELDGADQPAPTQLVEVQIDGTIFGVWQIEEVSSYRLERGTRELSLTARTRDANPMWRDTQRVTDIYAAGTWLNAIARDVGESLGLTAAEMDLPDLAVTTAHSNTQLANVTAWDMLETLYQPSGFAPFVDTLGVLRGLSRDTTRPADIVLTDERVRSVEGSRSRVPATTARVRWLDPQLTKVTQQAQQLATASLTAGFFQSEVRQDVRFSPDGTQRAEGTYMVIQQSCNQGLLPVADEEYEQRSETYGRITLENTYYAVAFITGALAGAMAAGSIPDGVQVGPSGSGATIPIGKIVQASLLFAAMFTMSSIGSGSYEIWGRPFDWVHARNTTEAYDDSSPDWSERVIEIENDFVASQAMSEAYAVRELLYAVRSATSYGLTIVDDLRVEPGDILQLADGSRLYVTGYSRDLSRGAQAELSISGFRA